VVGTSKGFSDDQVKSSWNFLWTIKYFAIGSLSSEGLVKSKDEIKKITGDDRTGAVRLKNEEDKRFIAWSTSSLSKPPMTMTALAEVQQTSESAFTSAVELT
jgi:formate dehydrogenase assembly factor FdhD